MNSQEDIETKPANLFIRAGGWIWRLLSSVKLALILILIIVGLGLIGAFLVQVPSDMLSSPQVYAAWVDQYGVAQVGAWAPLIKLLQLFHVFSSIWFLGAGTLLMINILVCSLNRWGNIKLGLQGGTVKREESFLTSGKEDSRTELAAVPVSGTESAHLLETVLRKRHYRVRIEKEGENVYIAADKNRWFRLATYVSHLSLILFVVAFIFGSLMGWHISTFMVTEGTDPVNNQVGHDTNLSLRLDNFSATYYDNGSPKDYSSEVTLFENGQQVRQATIRVNHPLQYNGVSFYQSSYGSALHMQVNKVTSSTDTTTTPVPVIVGDLIFDDNIAMSAMGGGMGTGYAIGSFDLPEQNLIVYVISSTDPEDSMIPAGSVGVEIINEVDGSDAGLDLVGKGTPAVIGNLQFTYFGDTQYSGFQVSKDPTVTLIWIASALFIIGICLVLYFPYRQVWAISQKKDKGNSRVLVRTIAPRSFGNKAEVDNLTGELKKRLGGN